MDLEPHHDEMASKEVQSATGALKVGGPVPDKQLNRLRDALDHAQDHTYDDFYEHLWDCTKDQLLESTIELQEVAEQTGDPSVSETAATIYRVVEFMRRQERKHDMPDVLGEQTSEIRGLPERQNP